MKQNINIIKLKPKDMKKLFTLAPLFVMGWCALTFVACSDDDKPMPELTDDDGGALSCVEQILDGCNDIANEVGEAKIGDPLGLYLAGDHARALYAVESWYSWRSRQDYSNNILSIRNAYYGSLDGTVATASLSTLLAGANAELDKQMRDAIAVAYNAILAIPDPFCQHIACEEAEVAQEKCAALCDVIGSVKSYIKRNSAINTNEVLDPIVANYVDAVVLPTYKTLSANADLFYTKVQEFVAAPSNATFEAVAKCWIDAREPWEESEAFLGFGPVDALGLDPNMDSWPLDQDQIANILTSGNYDELNWSDDDDDDAIEAAQGVRGFHTLEFLIFKNGKVRTTTDEAEDSSNANLVWTEQNKTSWGNYMLQCAKLLKADANTLYNSWNTSYNGGVSYASLFKSHNI